MIMAGHLHNAEATGAEVLLVAGHQQCFACTIAKWKALVELIPSGIRPSITGAYWTMDIQGPYAIQAIGGYVYQLVFFDRSCGYCLEFQCELKTDVLIHVNSVNQHCKRFGWMMRDLRTDMGAVECGADFQRACADINLLPGNPIPGINVNYANIGLQRQNPAERGWQHFKNMQNAIIVGQGLLP